MLKLLVLVSLLHISVSKNTVSVLSQQIKEFSQISHKQIAHANKVVSKIYNSFRQWYFTVTFCQFTFFENIVLKQIQIMGYGYPVLLLNGCPATNKTKVIPKLNIHGETAYIVTSETISLKGSEFIVDSLKRTGVFKPRNAIIFVINFNKETKLDSYFFYEMKNHFQFLWSRSITSSVVMLLCEGELKTFTFDSVSETIKDLSHVKDISHLLSHQNENLQGRELRLSVYKKIFEYDDKGPAQCTSRLALTVMDRFNASCKPLIPRDGNTVGDLLSNGNATGVTADLLDGYTDMELSSRILKNSFYGYIDTTYPLTQDELCFMVKAADKQSTFMTTINLISVTILSLFMLIVISMIFAALLAREVEIRILNLEYHETRATVIFDLLKCFIRQSVNIKFNGPVYRGLVLLIIVYSLIVDCVMDGILTSAITNPRYKSEISTLQELYATNLTLGIHNRYFDVFDKGLEDDAREMLLGRIKRVYDKDLKEIIKKRKFQYASLLRKSDAINICRKQSNYKNGRPLFQIVSECPIPTKIVYGLRLGSPYLPKLNSILQFLYQGGILNFWFESEQYKVANSINYVPQSLLKKLDVSYFSEVFIVWIIGLTISTVVFLIELLIFWCKNLNSG